jgi:MFS transporter, DHA1 family, inner membrane transport protein
MRSDSREICNRFTGPINSFTALQIGVVIAIAAGVGNTAALQPALLGSLLAASRISAAQVGQLATIESLCTALTAALAGIYLKPTRLRPCLGATLAIAIAANVLTALADSRGIFVARGISGVCTGVTLWLILGLLARLARPARLVAIFVVVLTGTAFLMSSAFTLLSSHLGVAGGYHLIAAVDVIYLGAVFFLPRRFAALSHDGASSSPSLRGTMGLLVIFLKFAGLMALWVYVTPLGLQIGYTKQTVNLAISAGIAFQIVGALLAIGLASRLDGLRTVFVNIVVLIAMIWLMMYSDGDAVPYYVSIAIFALIWMFSPPFQMSMIVELDSSRRSTLFLGTAQLLGMAAGPLLAALTVGDGSFSHVAVVATALFVSAGLVLIVASLVGRDQDAPQKAPT